MMTLFACSHTVRAEMPTSGYYYYYYYYYMHISENSLQSERYYCYYYVYIN